MAEGQSSAWKQIRDYYFLRGNVDQMLALRQELYKEIQAAQAAPQGQTPGFCDGGDLLRARAIAASLFILNLEKKEAAEMLHPYVKGEKYPEVVVNDKAIEELENDARNGKLGDVIASCAIMTQTASLRYRSARRDHGTGLDLTKRAEALFNDAEKDYHTASQVMCLPFLLARHENLLHLSIFQWMAGGAQMSAARDSLEKSLTALTIEYEKWLVLDNEEHKALAGSIEVLLTQTLGSLAERLWVEEPGTGWARARIYRSLQTIPVSVVGGSSAAKAVAQQIPGRSIDTCRRGYAFILASRIEADDTKTGYRLSIALATDAERCFKELAEKLGETHAWMIRARIQKLRCYIQAGNELDANPLYYMLKDDVEKIKDLEEYDFAKGSLALSRTWMFEREAKAAPPDQREKKWRKCLTEAELINKSTRIPGRLERDGLLHQGRALLNLAICLRRKGGSEDILRDSFEKENKGRQNIQDAITLARERHRPKSIAAGYVFLAEGLRETNPSAALDALHEVERLPPHAKTTYLQEQLNNLYSETPIIKDGFVTLPLDMPYKEALQPPLLAAYLDYHYHKAATPGGNLQAIRRKVAKSTGWGIKQLGRIRNKIDEWRGFPIEGKIGGNENTKRYSTKRRKRG